MKRAALLLACLGLAACPAYYASLGEWEEVAAGTTGSTSTASTTSSTASSSTGGDAGTGGKDGGLQCGQGNPGSTVWSHGYGDPSFQVATAVAVDADGNVIVTGENQGSVDFGCGAPASTMGQSFFVAKLAPDGVCSWSKTFSSSSQVGVWSLAVDASSNVVVAGEVLGSIPFGSSTITSTGGTSAFVAKLSSSGVPLWGAAFGENAHGKGVAVDPLGNVLTIGYFDAALDFGSTMLTSSGPSAFVGKLDGSGNPLWARSGGSADARGLAVDASGNVVVTGTYGPTPIDFGCGALPQVTDVNAYVAKLWSDGTCAWSKSFGGASSAWGAGVAVDPSANVVVTGHVTGSGSLDLGSGPFPLTGNEDMFVAKLGPGGDHEWGHGFGASGSTDGQAIAVDSAGTVFVAGYLDGSATFGGTTLSGQGGLLIASLDAGGDVRWAESFALEQWLTAAIAVDLSCHVVIAGGFTGSLDLGSGPLMSAGDADVFVAALRR